MGWVAFATLLSLAVPALAQTATDRLKQARDAFEYGDFDGTVRLLADLPESGLLALESDRIEAYRLLGLAHFFRGDAREATTAFFGLLKQNPDYALDPFYVPPHAVAFFDRVRKDHEALLSPIRERRRRRLREQELEDQARRAAEERRRQMLTPQQIPDVLEREVALNSRLVAAMPFGLGQFQNGHASLGSGLATLQVATGATSVLAFLAVEGLRDPDTGAFRGANYQTARNLDLVKWIGAAAFYALWLGGAMDANVRFVPRRVVSEGPAGRSQPDAVEALDSDVSFSSGTRGSPSEETSRKEAPDAPPFRDETPPDAAPVSPED